MKRTCVTAVLVACGLALALAMTSNAHAQWPPIQSPWNPVVNNSGQIVTGIGWNPWTGLNVNTFQQTVNASAYDPNRGRIDPGSLRHHNEWVPDGRGGWVRQTGTSWTSYGVYHHNMHYQNSHQTPFGQVNTHHQNLKSMKSKPRSR